MFNGKRIEFSASRIRKVNFWGGCVCPESQCVKYLEGILYQPWPSSAPTLLCTPRNTKTQNQWSANVVSQQEGTEVSVVALLQVLRGVKIPSVVSVS